MGTLLVAVVVIIGIAVVVAGVVYAKRKEDEREARLQAFGSEHGLSYAQNGDPGLRDRWAGDPFGNGDHRRVEDTLSGNWNGMPAVAFDYSYQTHHQTSNGNGGTTTQTTTHRYQVSVLKLPAALPRLSVGPESMLGRFGRALGMQDIELESEQFNRKFRVTSEQPDLAYQVLHPRMMEWLLSLPGVPEFRMGGTYILAYDEGRQEPADIQRRFTLLEQVVRGIPDFVWKDHRDTV